MTLPTALVVNRLCERFPAVPETTIVSMVASIEESYHDARIRDFIPLLIEREVRDLLAHHDYECLPDAG